MGKNFLGGNKSKKGARKHQNDSATQKATRYAKEEGEIYACVTRIYGGQHCEVKCVDGRSLLCVIRNKFRGRGKRDNTLSIGVWILIGERVWETPGEGKLSKCDLLEVYSTADRNRLKSSEKGVNWSVLAGIGQDHGTISDEEVEFADATTTHYDEILQTQASRINFGDDSDSLPIDVDDI